MRRYIIFSKEELNDMLEGKEVVFGDYTYKCDEKEVEPVKITPNLNKTYAIYDTTEVNPYCREQIHRFRCPICNTNIRGNSGTYETCPTCGIYLYLEVN